MWLFRRTSGIELLAAVLTTSQKSWQARYTSIESDGNKTLGKFVGQCIVVVPVGFAEVPSLNRLARNMQSKSWWNKKRGSMF